MGVGSSGQQDKECLAGDDGREEHREPGGSRLPVEESNSSRSPTVRKLVWQDGQTGSHRCAQPGLPTGGEPDDDCDQDVVHQPCRSSSCHPCQGSQGGMLLVWNPARDRPGAQAAQGECRSVEDAPEPACSNESPPDEPIADGGGHGSRWPETKRHPEVYEDRRRPCCADPADSANGKGRQSCGRHDTDEKRERVGDRTPGNCGEDDCCEDNDADVSHQARRIGNRRRRLLAGQDEPRLD